MNDEKAVSGGTRPHRSDHSGEDRARPYVPRIAADWLAADPLATHRRVDGTLLFADIAGFTRLSERLASRGRAGAEEVAGLIGAVLTALVAELEARGGDVLIFAGDALVVLFVGHGAATRAAQAAAAVRQWFAARGSIATSAGAVTLRVSVGLASGPVDLILAGAGTRGLFVAGPTTTEMVRLERAAEAGQILLDQVTADSIDQGWLGEAHPPGRLLRHIRPRPAVPAPRVPPPTVDLTGLLPAELRPFLVGANGGLEGENRLATIAFVLAGGLDARLGAEPESVVADLDALYRTVAGAAERHRVTLLGTDATLDGVTLFLAAGAPVATGQDEERMLRVLREILDSPESGVLRLRAGVNRGPVFAGDLGAPTRRTYTAMGDTTNLAARIAARAAPGELLATADVLSRSALEFENEPLPAFTPKGKRDPVVPYRVGRSVGRHARTPARLPLAGREVELGLLVEALGAAARGSGRVVSIVGDPGSGKSRLVQELLGDARIGSLLVARFTAADEATPYGGVQAGLRDLAGIDEGAEPPTAGELLTQWVEALAPALIRWLPLIAIPFGASVPTTTEVTRLAPAFRRRQLHTAIIELLELVLRGPAVLVLEDLHWADEASFALLEALAEAAPGKPWLVIGLQRPGSRPFGGATTRRVDLPALGPDAVVRVALAASGSAALSDADLASITERAAGNPLFARELASAAAVQGSLEDLPDRLESLLASRIDRLDGPRRALLRRAAVLGRTVDLDLLGEVLDDDDVANDLTAWSELDDFVARVDSTRVRFRHDLVRVAAYEGLSNASRRTLHARLATAIERRAGADTDVVASSLALHFERGGLPEPAFRYARRAGDIARDRYANVDASALYGRALACASLSHAVPAAEVAAVAEARGDVAELAGRYDESLDGYARARGLRRLIAASPSAEAADGDAAAVIRAQLARKTGVVCERAGHYGRALAWYARGQHRLDGAVGDGVESLRIRLMLDRAGIRFRQGRWADCIRVSLPAAAAAERAGDRALLAHAWYLLHAAYGVLGSPEAAHYRDLPLPIYEELGDLVGQGNVLNNLGIQAYFEGRWDEALAMYRRSKEAKARAGDVANAATQSNNEAEILSDQGHYAAAEELLGDALRVWRAAGYEIGIALATSNLGRAGARAGRHDAGLALLEDAAARFGRIGAEGYVDETRARIAEALVLAGRAAEAEAIGRETLLRVHREAPTSVLGAQLERTLGWAALQLGEPERARGHFDASLAEARSITAQFEVALTLRACRSLPGVDPAGRIAMTAEADSILARLGVVAVAEPGFPP
ncbi:MAG TPA: AAA family ATPase [Candidatus Limnocylindrales bacterium]